MEHGLKEVSPMKILSSEWLSFLDGSTINSEAQKTIVYSDFQQASDKETGEIVLNYRPTGCWINRLDTGEYSIDFPGAAHIQQAGAPKLVQEGLLVAVPPGAEIKSLDVMDIQEMNYSESISVVPVSVPVKNTEPPIISQDPYIYNSDFIYPPTPVVRLGEEEFMGIYCTHLYVCPMKYQAKSQKLTFLTSLTIRITYQKSFEKKFSNERLRGNALMRDFILGCPVQIRENNKPRLIIVTSDIFKGCTSDYISAKSGQYDVKEVTVSSIHSKYKELSKPEAIREYLMEEYAEAPIHTVILAGSVAEVPSYEGYGCMSDSYYAQTSKDNYTPLFAISRFPAVTGTELREMSKYAAGYNSNKPKLRNNAIFIAYDDTEFIACSDNIVAKISSPLNPIKKYEGKCTHIDVIRSINAGCGFINYRGHGTPSAWNTANAPLLSEIAKLKVKTDAPHIFSIACLTNSIEVNTCYGVTWLRNQKAISFLGASRVSWRSQNNEFDTYLWELINNKTYPTIGQIYQAASCKLYINDKSKYSIENLQSYLLLGDATAEYGAS